jgi:hypothetical protein
MIEGDYHKFMKVLDTAAAIYGYQGFHGQIGAEVRQKWWSMFKGESLEDFTRAMDNALAESRFMPRIADVREHLGANAGRHGYDARHEMKRPWTAEDERITNEQFWPEFAKNYPGFYAILRLHNTMGMKHVGPFMTMQQRPDLIEEIKMADEAGEFDEVYEKNKIQRKW